MFVAEVRVDRTVVANTVFRGLRFENLDDGPRILGKSKERPKKNTKQNPLQRSLHVERCEGLSQSRLQMQASEGRIQQRESGDNVRRINDKSR